MSALPPSVQQIDHDGLTFYSVRNRYCAGEVCLQGAHITHFQPKGTPPILWMSDRSMFEPGKPIRGGMPFCFPNLGKGPDGNMEPLHGPLRLENWVLTSCREITDGTTIFSFLKENGDEFSIRYTISLGRTLGTKVELKNPSPTHTSIFELMLHTYFNIEDITSTSITGLEDLPFADRVNNTDRGPEHESITFRGERVERIYTTGRRATILDPGHMRKIHVDCDGGQSVLVWNPGPHLPFADVSETAHKRFVCLERGGARNKSFNLKPEAVAFMKQTISYEPL